MPIEIELVDSAAGDINARARTPAYWEVIARRALAAGDPTRPPSNAAAASAP